MTTAPDADTLRLLGESVAAFAVPDARRARNVRDTLDGNDRSGWASIGRMGWLGVMTPESDGGTALGLRAASVIARGLGYAGWSLPYAGAAVMPLACLASCPDVSLEGRLTDVVNGSRTIAVPWEFDSEDDTLASKLFIERRGDSATVSGRCRFVAGADADALLVFAQDGQDLSLHWLDLPAAGVELRRERAADGTHLADVHFDATSLSSTLTLAVGPVARAALAEGIAARIVATSAELIGVLARAFDLSLDHLQTRHQFGQPIGAFQVLQHRAVDMWIQKELAEAALHAALKVFEDPTAGPRNRGMAASSVKARAAHAAMFICSQAIQLHGAIGFTDEHELGVHVNRALVLCADYGNARQHCSRYARLAASGVS